MVDIVIPIASKVAEYLVAPILRKASYLFCFKKFIGDVDKAKQELEVKLADVKKRKELADRKTEEIMPSVKKWLDDVNAILEDVQKLQHELEEGGNKCFNVSQRYSLAKQMEDKANQMDLKQKSILEPFSQLKQLPSILNISSKGFINFNSRKTTYNRVLKAITDDNKKMVGLYGMGGSGKTTLVKQVGMEMESKFFEKVITVVISKSPNVLHIQQQIAEQIGLKLQEATQLARAQRLYEGLNNKKILVILDDVWEHLRLEDVGIPLVDGCHILLTTRLLNVCVSMDCEIKIELPLITKDEAWELFKKHANLCNDPSSVFDDVGREIINECKELPIAIVAVGSSLKEKPIEAWESALWRLKHFQPLNVGQGLSSAYACLELSFDALPNPTAKSLFLLCSMFPEDHEIHKEELVRFSKGTLELEETIVTMEDARREILDALQILLDSCLVMSIYERPCIKMHDLVRDVALWIAKKQGQAILVDSHAISNILVRNHQSLKNTKVLSLWNLDENFKLSNQLHCPTLEIILLHPRGLIKDLRAIDGLKVLALIKFSFTWNLWWPSPSNWSIPRSIESLTNLHTLCLREKNLDDISFLGELKGLEILDLRNSSFNELPAAIVDMKMLKLLDMFGCEIGENPLEVIGRCEQLEELYFWDKKSPIPENFSLSRLKRYAISDSACGFNGYEVPFQEYLDSCDEALRFLCIQSFEVSALNLSMKDLIHRANFLWLANCWWDHKDINHGIKHLGVSCCQKKRFIIDRFDMNFLQAQQVFSHLVTLSLVEMKNLEQVFQDSSISYSLPMLQELRIQSCPALETCIFTHTTITSLPKLRKLEIYDCKKVKWLFDCSLASNCPSLKEICIVNCYQLERLIEDDEDAQGNPLFYDKQDYPCVNENDEAYVGLTVKSPTVQIVSLHRLERVELRQCQKLKNIFTLFTVTSLPELRKVVVSTCEEWEGIFCEESLKNLSSSIVCFPKLEIIRVSDCHKVKRLFSYSLAFHCPSLKGITIYDCSQLEGAVQAYQGKVVEDNHERLLFPKLNHLDLRRLPKLKEIYPGYKDENKIVKVMNSELRDIYLEDLPELEYIWKGSTTQILSLHRLEEVTLRKCPKLKNIFTLFTVTSLPELRKVEVYTCKEWVGVFCEESLKTLSSSIVCFPKLEIIRVHNCQKVKRLFSYSLASHCPSLKGIIIRGCFQLEVVVQVYQGEDVDHHHHERLLFPKLNHLDLRRLPKLGEICPSYKDENKIVRVMNSELRDIYLEDLPELEYIWKGSTTQILSLHRLEEVTLRKCPKLKNIFTLFTVTSLPELRKVEVYTCKEWVGVFCEESLKTLSSSIVCFPKLEIIRVHSCEKVKRLFSYSLASHCPLLKGIIIRGCFQLEMVVQAYRGEDVDDHHERLLFPKLNHLDLKWLPKLREIYPSYKDEDERVRVMNSELRDIYLEDLPKLEYIWKGSTTQIVSFCRLEEVILWQCPKLKNIFTPFTITSLPELRKVIVYTCEEWEGIFCEESLKNLCSSIVCFPKLERIQVFDCHKVKRLFSYSLASHCPSLKEITIFYCSQLEGVVQAYQGEVVDDHHERLLFPKLNYFYLGSLPKLREIYPNYEFNHISGTISIEDCPNICNNPVEFKA